MDLAVPSTVAPLHRQPSHRRPTVAPKAGDRARTGDLNLGKVALYQLSYARNPGLSTCGCPATASGEASQTSGAEQATGGNRTHNPGITNAVLYR